MGDKQRKNELHGKAGDFLLDIAKLIVAGVVLSSIFDTALPKSTAIWWSLTATAFFTFAGFYFLYRSKK